MTRLGAVGRMRHWNPPHKFAPYQGSDPRLTDGLSRLQSRISMTNTLRSSGVETRLPRRHTLLGYSELSLM